MPDLLAGTTVNALDTPPAVIDFESADEAGFTSTTYVTGTVCGVVFTAPTTGRVLILWGVRMQSNTAAVRALASIYVRTGAVLGSGTDVQTPSDSYALETPAQARLQATRHKRLGGLTPGNDYNVVIVHKVSAAGNGDIFDRDIDVIPLP